MGYQIIRQTSGKSARGVAETACGRRINSKIKNIRESGNVFKIIIAVFHRVQINR